MKIVNNSFSIVLLGDWSKLYIQPEWIAENIIPEKKIDLFVNGNGLDYKVSYKYKSVTIIPSQERFTIFADIGFTDAIDDCLEITNNIIKKAVTPFFIGYGFNCSYEDEDTSVFSELMDKIEDQFKIIQNGYQINNTTISRELKKDGKILNFVITVEDKVKLDFNEHHGQKFGNNLIISREDIKIFLNNCEIIVKTYGDNYE